MRDRYLRVASRGYHFHSFYLSAAAKIVDALFISYLGANVEQNQPRACYGTKKETSDIITAAAAARKSASRKNGLRVNRHERRKNTRELKIRKRTKHIPEPTFDFATKFTVLHQDLKKKKGFFPIEPEGTKAGICETHARTTSNPRHYAWLSIRKATETAKSNNTRRKRGLSRSRSTVTERASKNLHVDAWQWSLWFCFRRAPASSIVML